MPRDGRWCEIDGPCPFLTCEEPGPHRHPICPECGAVRFGNLFCATCRSTWSAAQQAFWSKVPTRSYLDEVHGEA